MSKPKSGGRSAQIRLLVIDDSATVRAIVEQIVEQDADCQVVGVAASISVARRLLVELKPNLITLDLNMPGGGGLDLLDELRTDRHAPVIVLSSSTLSNSEAAREAIARGAAACFDKNRILIEAKRFRQLLKSTLATHERRAKKTGNLPAVSPIPTTAGADEGEPP